MVVSNVEAIVGYTGLSLGAVNMSHRLSTILLDEPISHADGVYTISVWTQFPLLPPTLRFRTLTRGQYADHQVLVNDDLELGIYIQGGDGFTSSGYSVAGMSAGWYHLAAVANGSHTMFYISGVARGARRASSAPPQLPIVYDMPRSSVMIVRCRIITHAR